MSKVLADKTGCCKRVCCWARGLHTASLRGFSNSCVWGAVGTPPAARAARFGIASSQPACGRLSFWTGRLACCLEWARCVCMVKRMCGGARGKRRPHARFCVHACSLRTITDKPGTAHIDCVAECLRRWARNPLGAARWGSSPLAVARAGLPDAARSRKHAYRAPAVIEKLPAPGYADFGELGRLKVI